MPKQLSPDEARQHMAAGGLVKDKDGFKWRSINDRLQLKWCGKWKNEGEDGFEPFESAAPFTTHPSRKELEQRVAELETALDDRSELLTIAHMSGAAESDASIRHLRAECQRQAKRAETAEAELAAVTAERDALANRVTQNKVLVPENEEGRIHTTPFMPITPLPEEKP